jgi:hypothetical protein
MSDLRKPDLSQARRAEGAVRLAVAITLRPASVVPGYALTGLSTARGQAGWGALVLAHAKARPLWRTAQAMRAGLLASAICVQLAAPERPGNCSRCYLLTISEILAISMRVPDEARGLRSFALCAARFWSSERADGTERRRDRRPEHVLGQARWRSRC